MKIRAIVTHDEIIQAVVKYLEDSTEAFSGGIPKDAVLKIVDVGGQTYEVAIAFEEKFNA